MKSDHIILDPWCGSDPALTSALITCPSPQQWRSWWCQQDRVWRSHCPAARWSSTPSWCLHLHQVKPWQCGINTWMTFLSDFICGRHQSFLLYLLWLSFRSSVVTHICANSLLEIILKCHLCIFVLRTWKARDDVMWRVLLVFRSEHEVWMVSSKLGKSTMFDYYMKSWDVFYRHSWCGSICAGSNYGFDWHLITHPKDYSGEMEGQHSKTLKLSQVQTTLFIFTHVKLEPHWIQNALSLLSLAQLTVGLYEFEVEVDGEGAHGEGYVNVTVKPGEPKSRNCSSVSVPLKSHILQYIPPLIFIKEMKRSALMILCL